MFFSNPGISAFISATRYNSYRSTYKRRSLLSDSNRKSNTSNNQNKKSVKNNSKRKSMEGHLIQGKQNDSYYIVISEIFKNNQSLLMILDIKSEDTVLINPEDIKLVDYTTLTSRDMEIISGLCKKYLIQLPEGYQSTYSASYRRGLKKNGDETFILSILDPNSKYKELKEAIDDFDEDFDEGEQ